MESLTQILETTLCRPLIGWLSPKVLTYSFTITAVPVDNPQALPVTTTLYISLLDPCTNPNSWIRGASQISPPEYTYTGGSPKVDFLLLNPFTTNIINCPITYSCKRVSGPILPSGAVDLCNFKDTAGSFGSFNIQTGNYQFSSTDSIRYPPGVYTFNVYGFLGNP